MNKSFSRFLTVGLLFSSLLAHALERDLSAQFEAVRKSGADVASLVAKLKKYHVVFVPGFMTNNPLQYQWFAKPFVQTGSNFADQMAWLTSQGVENHRPVLNTETTPDINAKVLEADIAKIQKPVLLITHSKGGVDSLHMLLSNKAMRSKIAGWLALQTPFFGTPVADEVVGNGLYRTVCFPLINAVGGTQNTILGLTTSASERFLADNAAEIETIVREIPTLSFLSTKPNLKGFDTSFELTRNWMDSIGVVSDGLIPETSARLPETDFVKFVGLDHGNIVAQHGRLNFARVPFTAALLATFFEANGAL